VKYPLFLSYFNGTWILLPDIKKTHNFMKIHSVGAKFFDVDGWMDRQTYGQT
jgi:hypothetical protein